MAITPGATIGILGGGQLGRMTAMAARELGYRIHVLDPDASCAARFVVEQCIAAPFDDEVAAAWLAHTSDVVTLEIEQVAAGCLEAAARHAPVRPNAALLRIVQDRAEQKAWLERAGFPLGPYRTVRSAEALGEACAALGGRVMAKATRGGYDGRSQVELQRAEEAQAAFASLGGQPLVVEQKLSLEAEISVLVARRPSGEVAVYPPALNHHEERILAWSVLPAPIDPALARHAEEIARGIAAGLEVEGLMVVEMFVVDGELLVNELAPRPHNSFHATAVGCATSQFEQHVRAICDLPLGAVDVYRPAAIVNLLGDLWAGDEPPPFERVLEQPCVRLHLYGKRVARPGRKMGHLSVTAETPEQAIETVTSIHHSIATWGTRI